MERMDSIIQNNSLLAAVAKEIGYMKKRGQLYYGRCPFHHESAPSFTVNTRTRTFYCYGCGEGGNIIDFEMKYHGIGFEEAVKKIDPNISVEKPQSAEKAKIYEMNREAARFYYKNLMTGKEGAAYFKNRALSDTTIRNFGLGYSGSFGKSLFNQLKKSGFTEKEILSSGLVKYGKVYKNGVQVDDYYDRFWNRVMFPIIDNQSRVIGFGGRVLDDSKPKYLNSPETAVFDKGNNLYGLNLVPKDSPIMLVEGYMDVISMHQSGFNYAVASLGTALTQSQAKLISAYTDTAYLAYDSDEPGINAAIRAIPILLKNGLNVKVVNLAPAKDPDEFVKKFGKEAFSERLSASVSGERFLFSHNKSNDIYESAADFLLNN